MLKLTQCLIVKNEKRNLPRAVSWGKDLIDELIVVDTGSTDGTPACAEKLGAKVLRYHWKDDFSAARNFAISRCTGQWIFFLDADEYFKKEDVPLLRPLIEKIDQDFVLENGERRRFNVVQLPWVNNGVPSRQVRVFRNDPCLRYAGALHEQLQASPGGYLRVYNVDDTPAVYHTGYEWSEGNRKEEKAARNFEVARAALRQSPGCAKLKLFAAEALMDEGKYPEADGYFADALKNGDGSIWPERLREGYKQWLNNFLQGESPGPEAKRRLEAAAHAYVAAVSQFPDDPDYDVLMSMICFKAKDVIHTIRFFNASLSKSEGRISENLMGSNGELYQKLREACEELKKLGLC